MDLTREELNEITNLFEDIVAYHCDENLISGEKVWTVLECLAIAKLQEFKTPHQI